MSRDASQRAWFWDGEAFAPCAGVPLTDRGFRYGMSFFESLAVRGGEVEFLRAHLARLEAACFQCGWGVDSTVLAGAGEWLRQQRFSGPVFARIYVTAGDGGPAAPVKAPRVFVLAEPRALPAPEACRLGVSPLAHAPLLGGLKTGNYWPNLERLDAARRAGCEEALLFNPAGELVSACMANVFAVLEGELVTPAAGTGARQGVVREWVLRRRPVRERVLSRDDLGGISECFLTSSWHGVRPAASLEGRGLEGAVAETLRREFFNEAAKPL